MKNEKTLAADSLAAIFKDINATKVSNADSLDTLMDKFYKLMRKHGIKQGTWTEGGGRLVSNFEWTMCLIAFRSHVNAKWDWAFLMGNTPKDLLAYGAKPKIKTK
jgi:hypothetical protein